MKLGKNWIEHPSTMNPGMSYFIHRIKRHVVAFDKNASAELRITAPKGYWIIRMRQGHSFGILYFSSVDAMAVAEGLK